MVNIPAISNDEIVNAFCRTLAFLNGSGFQISASWCHAIQIHLDFWRLDRDALLSKIPQNCSVSTSFTHYCEKRKAVVNKAVVINFFGIEKLPQILER